jgi:hypothetical protein
MFKVGFLSDEILNLLATPMFLLIGITFIISSKEEKDSRMSLVGKKWYIIIYLKLKKRR